MKQVNLTRLTRIPLLSTCLLAVSLLAGCGAEREDLKSNLSPEPNDYCDDLPESYFFSDTLQVGGENANGETSRGHWYVSFTQNNKVHFSQTDTILTTTYSCSAGEVLFTLDQKQYPALFNGDFTKLTLEPPLIAGSSALTYTRHPMVQNSACYQVSGGRYSTGDDELVIDPELGPTFLEFDQDVNKVVFGYGDIRESGWYDCSLGELHLHLNSGALKTLEVTQEARSVTFLDHTGVTLKREKDEPMNCTQEYVPVCGVVKTNRVCITAPCPTQVYKTFGNQCEAMVANAVYIEAGTCGDKEDQPYVVDDVCPPLYEPNCAKAKADIQCVTAPCESHIYNTYNNTCEARNGLAIFSFKGQCEAIGLDGQLSFDAPPVRLYNVPPLEEPPIIAELLPKSDGISVISARIEEDTLYATIGYSGCGEQQVFYNADASTLLESLPEQVVYTLTKAVEDDCDAYFETEFVYDLLPLRANFRAQVESDSGLLILGLDGPLYKR